MFKIDLTYPCAQRRVHVFPPLALVKRFPTHGARVTRIPALGAGYIPALRAAGYMYFRAWRWLHVFPRLALVTRIPALATRQTFSALGVGYNFHR